MSVEDVSRIEPCQLTQVPSAIADRTVELGVAAARLADSVAPDAASGLADLVRVMNCYYSNLIEGHNTRPRDIERLRGRLQTYVRQSLGLRAECAELVDVLYQRGELSRGDAAVVMALKARTASVAIKQLIDSGLVVSPSEKGRLRLHYGARTADVLFPRLFLPDAT